MNWKSETRRYGAVAMAIHWITAAALFGLLGSGLLLEGVADEAAKVPLLRAHAATGITVLGLTMLRIGWWAFADRRPAGIAGQPRWQALSAWLVHRSFYAAILVLAASGIAMLALSGAGAILIGAASSPLPDFALYPPRAVHGVVAWLTILLVAAHIAAALYHQFVRKDRLLGRMGLGRAG
jgi:cytochrome b561